MNVYAIYTDVYIICGDINNPLKVKYQGRTFKLNKEKSSDNEFYFYNKEEVMRVKKSDLKTID